jgi:hypothetical protein
MKNMKAQITKLSSIASLIELFSNDYMPKDVYDNLITIFVSLTVVKTTTPYTALKAILTHPHCTEDTVKILISAYKKVAEKHYSQYFHRARYLTELLDYQPVWTRTNLDFNQLDPEIRECTDRWGKRHTVPKKTTRTSEKLEHLAKIVQLIKNDPATYLTDTSDEVRVVATKILQRDEEIT